MLIRILIPVWEFLQEIYHCSLRDSLPGATVRILPDQLRWRTFAISNMRNYLNWLVGELSFSTHRLYCATGVWNWVGQGDNKNRNKTIKQYILNRKGHKRSLAGQGFVWIVLTTKTRRLASTDNLTRPTKTQNNTTQKVALINSRKHTQKTYGKKEDRQSLF